MLDSVCLSRITAPAEAASAVPEQHYRQDMSAMLLNFTRQGVCRSHDTFWCLPSSKISPQRRWCKHSCLKCTASSIAVPSCTEHRTQMTHKSLQDHLRTLRFLVLTRTTSTGMSSYRIANVTNAYSVCSEQNRIQRLLEFF
jgi:hypothetical protein